MLKLLAIALVACPLFSVHDAMQESDWIRDRGLKDPQSKEWCCGENDCIRLEPGDIDEIASGYFYLFQTGESFPASRVLWQSKDGAWWRCHGPLVNGKDVKTRCLIGPPRST